MVMEQLLGHPNGNCLVRSNLLPLPPTIIDYTLDGRDRSDHITPLIHGGPLLADPTQLAPSHRSCTARRQGGEPGPRNPRRAATNTAAFFGTPASARRARGSAPLTMIDPGRMV